MPELVRIIKKISENIIIKYTNLILHLKLSEFVSIFDYFKISRSDIVVENLEDVQYLQAMNFVYMTLI